MSLPKITVIIPTRERCDVLQKTLLTVTGQTYPRLEILISDNFSADGTEAVVRGIADSRVRYVNTGRRISMAKNYEFALSHVDDGWVSIIGDDDGLMPASISRVAQIIGETRARAIRSNICTYVWPELVGKEYGRLAVPLQSGVEIRKSSVWLQKVLGGHEGYPQLPMLYYGGFVDVAVLKEIRDKSGSIYLSCIPDVYSAVAIASVIDSYAYSHEPLCISGVSRHSTGTSQFSNDPTKPRSPAQVFISEGNIPYHRDLPLCSDGSYPPSLQAMVYESYLQSAGLRSASSGNLHVKMLKVILATAARQDDRIEEWGRLFADRHQLNFDALNTQARRAKVRFRASALARRLVAAVNTLNLGSAQCPIPDIHQASIAAGAVRSAGVGRLNNVLHRLQEYMGRA